MDEKRYAILIANSKFPEEPKFPPLRCPEKDADELYKVLRSEQSNFTEVILLKNEPYYKILKTISQTLRKGGKDDLYLIYYSGHGKLDLKGSLYLATLDTTIDDLLVSAIEATKILDIPQEHFKKKTVLILDCCYSGAIERRFKSDTTGMLEVTFKSDQDEIDKINDKLKKVNQSTGTYVLTASTSNQQAVEKEGDELSLFTKHIVEGIRSSDASEDGEITMSSLYEYVRRKVTEEGFQEPMKFETAVNGSELVLASVDVSKFSTKKLATRGRELILVKYAADIPEDIQRDVINILGLDRELSTPEQKKKFTLIQNLIKDPKTVEDFVTDWNNLKKLQEQLVDFYEEARSAVKAEEWSQAVKKLSAVLEIDPEHKQALADLALAQQQLKLADFYEQGKNFYDRGEFGKAIPYLEQIHNFFPAYKDVGNLLNRSQFENKRQDQQEEKRKEYEELDRKQEKAQAALEQTYNAGMEHFVKGDWAEALKRFYQVRDKHADFPNLRNLIEDSNILIEADEAIKTQDPQKLIAARDRVQKASEGNPKQWRAYKSRISEAIRNYLSAEYAEAKKLYSMSEFQAALELFTKIRDLDEKFASIDAEIIETRKKLVQVSANSIASSPDAGVSLTADADRLFYEARTASGAQQFAVAIEKLQEALILKPDRPEFLEELEKAKGQQTLATFYAAAKERLDAKDWHGALGPLYSIKDKQEFYKDVDELIQLAESEGEKPVANAIKQPLLIAAGIIGVVLLAILAALIGSNGSNNANNNNPVISKVTPTSTPALKTPSKQEIDQMVKITIRDFNAAVQKRDFTDFYNNCSLVYRNQTSAEGFKKKYAQFIAKRKDVNSALTSTGNMSPTYSPEPGIERGILGVKGSFPTGKTFTGVTKTVFEFSYSWEDGSWKLFWFNIDWQ